MANGTGDFPPSIRVCKLYEKTSKSGSRYFTGRWGGAKVALVKTKEEGDGGDPIWALLLSEAPAAAARRRRDSLRPRVPLMSEPNEQSCGQLQRRWGCILADLPRGAVKQFILDIINRGDGFAIYTLLIALKFRFDCPELVFVLLDEIAALQVRRAPEADFDAWAQHARAALGHLVGVNTDASKPLLN